MCLLQMLILYKLELVLLELTGKEPINTERKSYYICLEPGVRNNIYDKYWNN